MATDEASPCWSENCRHHAYSYDGRAWPISARAHWPSRQYACTEGLHFSAFHWVCLCVCVCVCVCLLSHISPTERLFVLKTLPRTQRATKVKKFVGICLKRLRSRVMPRNMSEKANMLIIPTYRCQLSPLDTQRRARGYPTIVNNIQSCPKTMPTDVASPRWSEN